jgi:hypothetical protein
MPTRSKKPQIPTSVKFRDAARRLLKAAAQDLQQSMSGKSTSKATRRRKSKTTEPKKNPWPRCRTPGCFHWVPELCDYCQRGRAGVTENHTTSCCPGSCSRCYRCTLLCPGPCTKCSLCLDRCPGHDKDTSNDDD